MMIGLSLAITAISGAAKTTPVLSVPALAFVARDISGASWPARVINGAAGLTLTAVGTPAISYAETWANRVPVLNCAAGCFYADRTPWAASYGFSVAFTAGGSGSTAPVYLGPVNYAAASTSLISMKRQNATTLIMFTGDGTGERYRFWTGGYASGDTLQFDRPAGTDVALSAWSAFEEGVVQSTSTSGLGTTASDGPRFILGGISGLTGVITPNADNRILAAVVSQSGAPFSAGDRAAVTAWLAALKSGAQI